LNSYIIKFKFVFKNILIGILDIKNGIGNMNLDKIQSDLVYRSVGDSKSRERIGAGFLHKPNVSIDNIDFVCSYYAFVYVLRGRGEYIDASGNRYQLIPGSFFQRFPGIKHSNYIDPESQWAECFIDTGVQMFQALSQMRIIKTDTPVGYIGLNENLLEENLKISHQLKNSPENQLPDMLIRLLTLLNSYLGLSYQQNQDEVNSEMKIIDKACQFLGRDLNEKVDLQKFCRQHGWSYEKFRKVFQKKMGISPGKYRIRRRIDASCQLLSYPDARISLIATELGYSSPYEFSAQFKKYMGISPNHFRLGKK
jgi:AraC-like DNA-binding protein